MSAEEHENAGVDRRSFIRNMGLVALAATAAGTGAAVLSRGENEVVISTAGPLIPSAPAATLPPLPAVQAAQDVVQTHQDAAQVLGQLAEAQAENIRLQGALAAAQSELDALRQSSYEGSLATEELSLQLGSANTQIGVLGGLVALYQQLDGVDVTDTIQNGMALMADTIGGLVDGVPTLSEGVAAGQQALAEVEAQLPILENGRLWLDAQTNKLGAFYETVELVLQNVLESVGSFLEMVESWLAGVRKWLPFGISEKASQVVNALSDLVAETPHTVSGLNTYLAQPLDTWLARENDVPRLHNTLIKPIREQVLAEADKTINQAYQVQTTYQTQLAEPLQQAQQTRDALRQQIAAYREQNLI
jgi:hypothetical protein